MSFLDWNTITIEGTTPFGTFKWDSSSLNDNTAVFASLGGDFISSEEPIKQGVYPELDDLLFGTSSVETSLEDMDLIMNVKNTNSMDEMFENLFFNSDDVPDDAFNRTAIDWVDRIPAQQSISQKKFLAPFDPPIEPIIFPSFFTSLRKIGTSSFSYLSRFIKQKNSTEIVPQYKFKKNDKEANVPDELFANYADELEQVVDVLNDFNPAGANVNIPWDCGDNKVCEVVQVGLEYLGGKKIEKFIDAHKNDTPTSSKEFEDGTHHYIELEQPYSQHLVDGTKDYKDLTVSDIDIMFSNSSNVILEKRPNGDILLNTQQTLDISYQPITILPTQIKNKLVSTSTELDLNITNLQQSSSVALSSFKTAEIETKRYLDKYNIVVGRSAGYADPDAYRSDVKKAYKKYIARKQIEDSLWNDYASKKNKETAIKLRKYDDTKKIINSLIDDTCMNGEQIKNTVNDIFGDVLTADAVSIFNEHIDKKKIETDCCIKVCCDPCKYKLKK